MSSCRVSICRSLTVNPDLKTSRFVKIIKIVLFLTLYVQIVLLQLRNLRLADRHKHLSVAWNSVTSTPSLSRTGPDFSEFCNIWADLPRSANNQSDLIKVEAAFQKRFDAHKVFGHWTKNWGSVSDGELRARLKLKCKLRFLKERWSKRTTSGSQKPWK